MKYLAALLATLTAPAATAHPHVFIETQVTAVYDDQNRLTGVRLVWTYDDLFSLLVTEDLGIDPDGDLTLTEAEAAQLDSYMQDWPEDFGGDLLVMAGGAAVPLAPPTDHTGRMENGRVIETHFRPLATHSDGAGPVTVQVFDPLYYTAYSVVGDLGIEGGADCTAAYTPADLNKAYSLVDELLYGRPASDVGPDEPFPEVGQAFDDTVTLTCADS